MTLIFLLNNRYGDLAQAEAKAAAYGWGWWRREEKPLDNVLVLESRARIQGLALTRFVSTLKAACHIGNLRSTLPQIATSIKGSYRVSLTNLTSAKVSQAELASLLWRSVKNPKVDLLHPDMIIDIIITSSQTFIGLRKWTNSDRFEDRRAHLRPNMHPSSMHPALARAIVNISCARSMHDPCCGSGGILLEAGISGRKVSGGDVSEEMIIMARQNCASLGLHPELRITDATSWIPRTGAIICDLPYGKNTSPVALSSLAEGMLLRAAQSTSRAVLGVPTESTFSKQWSVRAHFAIYVHKSMTKHFYVLEKNHA